MPTLTNITFILLKFYKVLKLIFYILLQTFPFILLKFYKVLKPFSFLINSIVTFILLKFYKVLKPQINSNIFDIFFKVFFLYNLRKEKFYQNLYL